jgi:hypothetical protein
MRWGKNEELRLQKLGRMVVSRGFQAVLDAPDQVSGNFCASFCASIGFGLKRVDGRGKIDNYSINTAS